LVLDAKGNLYGTPQWGNDLTCNAPEGGGIVFKVSKDGKVTGSRHRVLLSLAVTNAALEEIVEREAFLAARRSRVQSLNVLGVVTNDRFFGKLGLLAFSEQQDLVHLIEIRPVRGARRFRRVPFS
jgi:hypothetical protein